MTKAGQSWTAMLMLTAAVLLTSSLCPVRVAAQQEATAENPALRWEQKIQEFEKADRENPPTPGQILFIGSSSIVRWKLDESFPGLSRKTINRGFGGSMLSDAVYYFERIIPQHRPSVIVLYSGGNDLYRGGQTPQLVLDSFHKFVALTRKHLPRTRLICLTINPCPGRWNIIEQVRETNALLVEACRDADDLTCIDVSRQMLGKDGKPLTEFFVSDQVHLSPEGYALWTKLLRPHLEQ